MYPTGLTPWVIENILVVASFSTSLFSAVAVHSSLSENFSVFNMEKSKNTPNSEVDFFKIFCENPRHFDINVLQGSHKFISLVLRNKTPAPKKSILIDIFNEFTSEPIKDYVFHRISKKLLLELALRIIQEITEKGAGRANSLQLVVEKTSNGAKSVVIARNTDNNSGAAETFEAVEIDDSTFKLTDRAGVSPDISVAIGKQRKPPYQEPDARGYFTPKRRVRKSLAKFFQVQMILCKSYLSLLTDSFLQDDSDEPPTTTPAQGKPDERGHNAEQASECVGHITMQS